jgi:hypothetical protein
MAGLLEDIGGAILPIGGQFLGGAIQSIFSGKNRRQKELEKMSSQTPLYNGGSSISKYYNEALNRYSVNPYSSPLYAMQTQNANRATNQALSALGDRRAGIGSIGKLTGIQDDATLRAGIAAENEQSKRFGVLGNAAGMQTQNERYAYQNNQLNPYLRKLQIAQQKAQGASNVFNAGLGNMFGALSSATMLAADANKTKKDSNKASGGSFFSDLGNQIGNAGGLAGMLQYNADQNAMRKYKGMGLLDGISNVEDNGYTHNYE